MDFEAFHLDNGKARVFSSIIPEITKRQGCMLGVDEAGRGPVLGPMVYGICFCPLSMVEKLESMKFCDSKTLSEEARENLCTEIVKSDGFMGWMVEIIPANVISNNMLQRNKYNLNLISQDSAANLINRAIERDVDIRQVYVDTVGDAGKYQAKLSKIFPHIKITVTKKADSIYPIVSAASICAKVFRDSILKSWNFKEGVSDEERIYGSGYPSDPQTKAYLVERIDQVFGFTQLIRFSWSTANKLIEDKCTPVTWGDDDDEKANGRPVSSVLNYFKRSLSPPPKKIKPHSFFHDRMLSSVGEF